MISKGAFGEVWKVKKEEGNEIFALKILNILKKDEEKMLKEVDILRILNNPGNINIVEIKDSFYDRTQKKLFIVMEYCPSDL